ncbi:MAG: ISAs1 family transposase [Marinilabilia sp.]
MFSEIEEPRRKTKGNYRHELTDIVLLVISAVISGASEWEEIEMFGRSQQDWLSQYGSFSNGIPSHDTINRVISSIDPDQFSRCFSSWINEITSLSKGEVVAIDGKRLRGSYNNATGAPAIHMVSAFASENGLCLGQVSTHEKSNEITAIPELLDNLTLHGCTVTIDAMGCQTAIAEKIREKGADYILAVKGNQGALEEGIKDTVRFNNPIDTSTNVDAGHGRIETRICNVYHLSDHMENIERWKDLKYIIEIQAERVIKSTGQITKEKRYYITNKGAKAKNFNKDIRSHWSIENNLHWVLDVTFGEDASRKRQKFAAQNFNTINKIALTLLANENTLKASKKCKRLAAAVNPEIRAKILNL